VSEPLAPCTRRDLTLYFLRLGATGFGGPIALAGHMQRDLVERRRWIAPQDYVEGLALSQLSPGPLAAQLAMYLGWVRGGFLGATAAGVAFVLPSFLMVIALAWIYVRFGGPWIQGVFYGVGAAVVAVFVRSVAKLARMTLARDVLLWALFAISAVVTGLTESEIIWLVVGSGVVAMLVKAPPRFRRGAAAAAFPAFLWTGLHGPASGTTLARIAWFFTKAGAFVFGSGLAIVPFLYSGVVKEYGWLDDQQFRDAVAVAMITPGPVVITAGFIGYLAAGVAGAVLAAVGTFVPPYLVVVLAAKQVRRASQNPTLKAFIAGVTAAATGAIAGAAFVLGKRAIVDLTTALLAVGTLVALVKVKRVPEPVVILAAAAIGFACHRAHGPAAAEHEQVLFVCEHGAAKSVIAATYFNQMAAARGLSVRATARGADPQDSPSTSTTEGLRADGLSPVVDRPQPVAEPDVRSASLVVAFDCDQPAMKAFRSGTCWNDVPTVSDDYGRARDAIRTHVAALVDATRR
jgi:chromate transporter